MRNVWSSVSLWVCCVSLAGIVSGQTVRIWTSNSDQRWNRGANWSGSNPADANNEIAQFGTGNQLNPELNANNYTVRGLQFAAGAGNYHVGDDNGSRTLKIGNGSSGFIENLSAADQAIDITTLQFQSAGTIRTTGVGRLTISSNLTGTNRNLTFNAVGDISVTGKITTGSGTLTKQGAGNLNLSGANTYTGLTTVSAGAIVLAASNVFANSAAIAISAGAALRMNGLSDTVARISGNGAIDFGTSGTGQLTLSSGTSTFAGSFTGAGELIVGSGATLTLGADFANTDLNITLAGGTLRLAGHSFEAGALKVTGNSIIDFGTGAGSDLAVDSLAFSSTSLVLTVQNWTNAADFFYSDTAYLQGSAPLNQVKFQGWTTGNTKWQAYDGQITPVPEPRFYGALLLGLGLWWGARRVCQRAKPALE